MSHTPQIAAGHYEPVLTHTVLRRCQSCSAPHPLARDPKAPDGVCPDCGTPSITGVEIDVPAVLTGKDPVALFANALLTIGRSLFRFTKEN